MRPPPMASITGPTHTWIWCVNGLSQFGAYPSDYKKEELQAPLIPAYRWSARVVRVSQMEKGDSVSYGRKYIATKPTWIATVPIGHADGYPRTAVNGAVVFIKGRVYPVIGAVSASHTRNRRFAEAAASS